MIESAKSSHYNEYYHNGIPPWGQVENSFTNRVSARLYQINSTIRRYVTEGDFIMQMITVSNLKKDFKYYKKEEGLGNSIKNLFNRKNLIKTAVQNISFEIEEGEFVGFLGPNGAGKTTTLKMLSGIMHPSGGSASVLGYTPWKRDEQFKKQFSIVMGQKNQLWWDLPASESFKLNKCIYELDDADYRSTLGTLCDALDVGQLLNIQVRRLSLGERMKMELIAALLHHPKVIFLDEPTIGLDLIAQKNIRSFLQYYNEQNKTTILLTSHYMRDIEELCKRTIVISQGALVYDGALGNINETLNKKKIIRVKTEAAVQRADFERFGILRETDGFSATLEIDRAEINASAQALLANLPVLDINIEDIPLEESIAQLYKKAVPGHG